jgi:hypothetical protein
MGDVNRYTKLSELRARSESLVLGSPDRVQVPARLLRSVEESMLAEGHVMSREHFERETVRAMRALISSSK